MKLCPHLRSHRQRYGSLAHTRQSEEQERTRIGIADKLRQHTLGLRQSDKLRHPTRAILLAEADGERKRRGGHRPPPCSPSVCETWNTVVFHARRNFLGSPVSLSISLLARSMNVSTLTPCSPRRTVRPRARHALNVNTFSRGRISDSGMPLAMNP